MNGSSGTLCVRTCLRGGKTVLDDCFFTPPYKVAHPFPESGGGIRVMVMSASAGTLEGDRYAETFFVGEGSRLTVTGQSYTKLFKMGQGHAERRTRMTIERDAVLRYLPPPVLPFGGSRYRAETVVDVQQGGSLIYRDILSCGRAGMGEVFRFAEYRAALTIYYAGRPVLRERMRLCPAEQPLSAIGYYEGYTHQATLFFLGGAVPSAERLYTMLESVADAAAGVTETLEGGRLVRILGRSAGQLEQLCDALMS
ncbi:MAG: urease accessory protein UreD [Ethanoligenens sp.]|uniref:urease accessory protein UreD n=1 Tax=Ethanoligenens sp. TaxID=2099655 RepID=UPI0039EB9F03